MKMKKQLSLQQKKPQNLKIQKTVLLLKKQKTSLQTML